MGYLGISKSAFQLLLLPFPKENDTNPHGGEKLLP
jgi:hypothetical protein